MDTTNLSDEKRRTESLKKIYTISDEDFLNLSGADIKKFIELLEPYNLSDEEISKLLDEEVKALQGHIGSKYKYNEMSHRIFETIAQRQEKDVSSIDFTDLSKDEKKLTDQLLIVKRKLDTEKSELIKSIKERIFNKE